MERGKVKDSADKRRASMTDEEMRMVDDYLTKIENNKGYLNDYYARWEREHEAYMGDQAIKENRPNTRINIIQANIEGQVATLIDQNIAITCRGEGPSDKGFSNWARIGLDWALRQNHIKRIIDRHERRRELFGPAWLKVHWDKDAIDGYGLAKITCPPLSSIFIDLKITDPADLEEADYIAEVMIKSKSWALMEYGEDLANEIYYGGTDRRDIFEKEHTTDDEDAFYLIQLWTKTYDEETNKSYLRMIEFSDDGVLLFDSFKENKNKPFYRYNKYPYFLTLMYPEEGKLYGFGDGKLLMPLQDMLNDLYDQVRIASRPNRVFFDPNSNVDLDTLDEDDGPVPCDNPNVNIRIVEVGRVNPGLWQLINNTHQEIQRVTRFSELMMGLGSKDKTATESTIQQQQGGSATDHKKGMLQETLTDLCKYMLALMMEHTEEGKFFRIDEDKEDFEWVDFRQLNEVPVVAPPDEAFTRDFMQNNPDKEQPKWMQLTDEMGQGMTKSVEFDIEINIGAGLPKNKSFIYSMAEKLSKVQIEGKSLISWKEMRDFLRDFLGMPLKDDDELLMEKMQEIQQMMGMQGGGGMPPGGMPPGGGPPGPGGAPMPSPNAAGLGAGGGPQMSALPPSPGGAPV